MHRLHKWISTNYDRSMLFRAGYIVTFVVVFWIGLVLLGAVLPEGWPQGVAMLVWIAGLSWRVACWMVPPDDTGG